MARRTAPLGYSVLSYFAHKSSLPTLAEIIAKGPLDPSSNRMQNVSYYQVL